MDVHSHIQVQGNLLVRNLSAHREKKKSKALNVKQQFQN